MEMQDELIDVLLHFQLDKLEQINMGKLICEHRQELYWREGDYKVLSEVVGHAQALEPQRLIVQLEGAN